MPTVRRSLTLLVLAFVVSTASGCQLFSFLPSTTWKLNRGPAMDEGHAFFSVPDPQLRDGD